MRAGRRLLAAAHRGGGEAAGEGGCGAVMFGALRKLRRVR